MKNFTVGFELEYTSPKRMDIQTNAIYAEDYAVIIKHGELHYDGTVSSGFEFASKVFNASRFIGNSKGVPALFSTFRKIKASITGHGTPGMHVHFGRQAFTKESYIKTLDIMVCGFGRFFEAMADRIANQWCPYVANRSYDLPAEGSNPKNWDRYRAINLQNKATIEVRIFRTPANELAFMANMQLVIALVEYIRTKNVELNNWSEAQGAVENFIRFIQKNKNTYPELSSRLTMKRQDAILDKNKYYGQFPKQEESGLDLMRYQNIFAYLRSYRALELTPTDFVKAAVHFKDIISKNWLNKFGNTMLRENKVSVRLYS